MWLLLILISLFKPYPAFSGNNIVITCNSINCTNDTNLPLFNETRIYPNYSQEQTISLINSENNSCNLSFKSLHQLSKNLLAPFINISINSESDNNFFQGSLTELLDGRQIILGNLQPSSTTKYIWKLSLSDRVDNSFQNQSAVFDLDFDFVCDESDTPTNTPVPTNTPTPSPTSTPVPVPAPESRISLSEVFANPEVSSDEWVEIYNDNDSEFTLDGWYIKDNSTNKKIIPKVTIPAKSYYAFDLHDSIFNNSSSDQARLFNPSDVLISSSASYSSVSRNASWSYYQGTWCFTTQTKNSANNSCGVTNSVTAGSETIDIPQVLGVNETIPGIVLADSQLISSPEVAGATDCRIRWLPILFLISFLLNFFLFRNFSPPNLILSVLVSAIFYLLDKFMVTKFCCYDFLNLCQIYPFWHASGFVLPSIFRFFQKLIEYNHVRK